MREHLLHDERAGRLGEFNNRTCTFAENRPRIRSTANRFQKLMNDYLSRFFCDAFLCASKDAAVDESPSGGRVADSFDSLTESWGFSTSISDGVDWISFRVGGKAPSKNSGP